MHVDLSKKNLKYVASILDYVVEVHAKINVFPVLIIAHCLKYHDSKIYFIVVVIYILSYAMILQSLHSFLYICTLKLSLNVHVDIFDFRIPYLCFE